MDLDAVRTVVAVADAGLFQQAAADLSITQQAVSKRIAALEKNLSVRLFTRTARGAQLVWPADYLSSTQPNHPNAETWTPTWAQRSTPPHQPSGNNVMNRND